MHRSLAGQLCKIAKRSTKGNLMRSITEHCQLIPPDDPNALTEGMIRMVHTPPTPTACTAARQAVLARYDKPIVLQQLESIYNALVVT
jgi:glycosyltransferase involved in cell wall biosynthesis